MQPVSIAATGAYLPERRLANQELADRLPQTSDDWIRTNTGICFRHVAADDEAVSDMAYHAARQAIEAAGIAPDELGMVIVATCTPDYGGFPSTACLVQDRLGAKNAGAFDISAACTGFVYGLEVARGLAQADGRPMVLIGAEAMSRVLDWNDYKTCVLFGDGAGAVVLTTGGPSRGILGSYLAADGSGAEHLFVEGGRRRPFSPETAGPNTLQMNGQKVFNFAVKAMVRVMRHFLDAMDLAPEDIAYVIPHQANQRIINAAVSRVGVPEERFYLNLDAVANTSGASIPLALADLDTKGLLHRGDKILTVGFGAGMTYGGNLIEW